MKTRAVVDGNHWVINGKVITNGGQADLISRTPSPIHSGPTDEHIPD
jgi:alkylation response protein AidB-like acyl-CoA dehydrogenase